MISSIQDRALASTALLTTLASMTCLKSPSAGDAANVRDPGVGAMAGCNSLMCIEITRGAKQSPNAAERANEAARHSLAG